MSTAIRVICFTTLLLSVFGFRAAAKDFSNVISPPYYMVHYEGSTNEGELKISASYTLWLPPGVKTLCGVIVHQHGCGPGDDKEARVQAADLQWQALASKHECALVVPSYEQSDKGHCRWWHDPRNGSDKEFIHALGRLAVESHHPELETVPWALWGHSGGACWAGSMFLLYPERVVAVWLRSNVPLQLAEPIPTAALAVPVMCNLGTREGVTEKTNGFAWGLVQEFFQKFRSQGGLVGVAVDPNSGHDCGNSRYLAIPWFDACLTARLPEKAGDAKLKPMPTDSAWLAPLLGQKAQPASEFTGDKTTAVWLPNEGIAKAWTEFVKDGNVSDTTPPPPPHNVRVSSSGELTWEADADLESGIEAFVIERDGKKLARVPEQHSGYFVGRPTFQQIGYGDYPTPPLTPMRYSDNTSRWWKKYSYAVRTVNTAGLESPPSAAVEMTGTIGHQGSDVFSAGIMSKQWPKGPEFPPKHAAVKLDARLLDACTGHYEMDRSRAFPSGQKLKIWKEGDELVSQLSIGANTSGALVLYPISETNFFFKSDGLGQLTFVKNDKGEVTGLIRRFIAGGYPDWRGKKIKEGSK